MSGWLQLVEQGQPFLVSGVLLAIGVPRIDTERQVVPVTSGGGFVDLENDVAESSA